MKVILKKNITVTLFAPNGQCRGFTKASKACVFDESELNRHLHLVGAFNRSPDNDNRISLDKFKEMRRDFYCYELMTPLETEIDCVFATDDAPDGKVGKKMVTVKWFMFSRAEEEQF